MAEINNHSNQEEQQHNELNEVKRSLEGWREVLLPLNGLLNWEKTYHPAIIIGLNTFIFLLIWYFEPSVLTSFALLGLAVSLIDFLVPMIGPNFLASKWTGRQEQQYEDICRRIMNFKYHSRNLMESMVSLKTERPKTYFLIVMGALVSMAWMGSKMDNLLLTYFLITMIMLVPGIRRHGILQKYFSRAFGVITSLIRGKTKRFKSS
ncbi:ADP-ribosylation factor-like protein 6-interacting protein 1 [Pecten maximus]|uniref:ADP-ribosylation factor-like protein 6-interacting protein 1 n=1 Tax=Pecten maximus TaxID=6579 RepID=UPI0014581062|nr:ADP-ribosylation factor-like protein 6-interacting protein 1 [Pecten maximus]